MWVFPASINIFMSSLFVHPVKSVVFGLFLLGYHLAGRFLLLTYDCPRPPLLFYLDN